MPLAATEMDLGPHAAFIIGAYMVAAAVIVGMIVWIWLDYRRQRRMLLDLEARGVTRRSGQVSERKQAS
jgi:heme exporter protein D